MFSISDFAPIFPEIFVASMASLILLVDVYAGKRGRMAVYILVQLTLIVAAILTLRLYGKPDVVLFNGMFILDKLAILLKFFIYVSSFMAFLFTRAYLSRTEIPNGEYYVLALFSVLGMMVISSAHNFIILFLGLELFSLPLYAMIALRHNVTACSEAAVKYFVIGSLASGLLLYGLSMVYGVTQTLDDTAVMHSIALVFPHSQKILLFGMVFIIVGLTFKLGEVPFHMWVPDVYEGAPTPVILFLGTASKIAAAALAFRLLADSLSGLSIDWQNLLTIAAVLSMGLGNLAAIVQSNIKRMLAYSSIAHMGNMTLGLIAATPQGYGAALFYIISYAIMTLSAFGLVLMMNYSGYETNKIDDLRGLNSRNPWLALMMLLTMFSLAGIPPIVGFIAKVAVFEALIAVNQLWLAVVALLFSIIGAYYYIRVVKVMYFETPETTTPITYTRDMQLALSINGLLLLGLGIAPGYLFNLCEAAFHTSFY